MEDPSVADLLRLGNMWIPNSGHVLVLRTVVFFSPVARSTKLEIDDLALSVHSLSTITILLFWGIEKGESPQIIWKYLE